MREAVVTDGDYKKGQRVEISFDVLIPVDATKEQIIDWIDFNVRSRFDIKMSNPLCDHEMEAESSVTKRFIP